MRLTAILLNEEEESPTNPHIDIIAEARKGFS